MPMSRAFVKKSDQEIETLPERAINPLPNLVTVKGLKRLDLSIRENVAAPPPTLGRWHHLGGSKYLAIGRCFRIGPAFFLGVTQLTRTVNMQPDGKAFTSEVQTELFDVYDNPIGNGCGKELSKRIY